MRFTRPKESRVGKQPFVRGSLDPGQREHFWNWIQFRSLDALLVAAPAVLTLVGLSILATLSISQGSLERFWRQLVFFVIGLLIMVVLARVDYRYWRGYTGLMYVAVLGLLVVTVLFGVEIRGTRGWIFFFGLQFQPVEIVKVALTLVLAVFFTTTQERTFGLRDLGKSAFLLLLPVVLIWLQPDFGSSLILIVVWVGMLIVRGLTRRQWTILLGVGAIVSIGAWLFFLQSYQRDRIMAFVGLKNDPLGVEYNIRQSMIAIGSGGFLGAGLGQGTQGQLRFLPEATTDFLFAVIAEELGFVGSIMVLVLYAFLFYRILVYIARVRDDFSRYFGFGIGLIFFSHFMMNIGMNLGVIPVVGVPLPFVSYGGSALISSWIAIGLLQSLYRKSGVV